jgi:hypothetical protein
MLQKKNHCKINYCSATNIFPFHDLAFLLKNFRLYCNKNLNHCVIKGSIATENLIFP